jgi:hypothetical protein
VHNLDNADNNRANNLRKNEADWGGVGTNGECSNGATPDAFGYCTPTPQ